MQLKKVMLRFLAARGASWQETGGLKQFPRYFFAKAVVTVPAYFNDSQRQAKKSGESGTSTTRRNDPICLILFFSIGLKPPPRLVGRTLSCADTE